jgi:tRNA pseudouridine55 synthase
MKINGQRAYKLAREGKTVELEARPVMIYSNELTSYDYPFVKFTSKVGSGTYIRSLVEDLGKLLETGAYMSDLRRTTVGIFNLENAAQTDTENLLERTIEL